MAKKDFFSGTSGKGFGKRYGNFARIRFPLMLAVIWIGGALTVKNFKTLFAGQIEESGKRMSLQNERRE